MIIGVFPDANIGGNRVNSRKWESKKRFILMMMSLTIIK
jgi:hypothetical protein